MVNRASTGVPSLGTGPEPLAVDGVLAGEVGGAAEVGVAVGVGVGVTGAAVVTEVVPTDAGDPPAGGAAAQPPSSRTSAARVAMALDPCMDDGNPSARGAQPGGAATTSPRMRAASGNRSGLSPE
jgi:hypothetical protein